jgi:hypothetical protein
MAPSLTGHIASETLRVRVIDWLNPAANDFLVASQMWIDGVLHRRRLDTIGSLLSIQPKIAAETLRGVAETQARYMAGANPTRLDLVGTLEEMVDAYNAGDRHRLVLRAPQGLHRDTRRRGQARRAGGSIRRRADDLRSAYQAGTEAHQEGPYPEALWDVKVGAVWAFVLQRYGGA